METARLVLDRFFAEVSQLDKVDQREIWHILTALRGPDIDDWDESHDLKMNLTAPIRGIVCYELARQVGAFRTLDMSIENIEWHFQNQPNRDGHFLDHISRAIYALGKFYPEYKVVAPSVEKAY